MVAPHGLVGVGALGACVSLAPEVERPALPVPAQYAGDGVVAEAGALTAMPAWRDYFTDPGLRDAIETALANNRDLRLAATRVDEARAAYGIQRSAQFPTLNVEAGAGRSRTPADLNLTGRPLIGSQYQVEVGLATWELDFWGRVRSLNGAWVLYFGLVVVAVGLLFESAELIVTSGARPVTAASGVRTTLPRTVMPRSESASRKA